MTEADSALDPVPYEDLVEDHRERPGFTYPRGVHVTRGHLAVADVVMRTMPDEAGIENKTGPDLLRCLGGERSHLVDQLERMAAAFGRRALIIQGLTWDDLVWGTWSCRSAMHPSAVIGTLMTWTHRYGVEIYTAKTAVTAGILAVRFFKSAWRAATKTEDMNYADRLDERRRELLDEVVESARPRPGGAS